MNENHSPHTPQPPYQPKAGLIGMIIFICLSEVGGVRATLVLPPNREIDFDCACVCVACVRASERSCVREMIPLWLGAGGRICGYPSVPPGAGRDQKLELFEFRPMIGDRVESLGVIVWWSRCVVCFVEACVVGSWSWSPGVYGR